MAFCDYVMGDLERHSEAAVNLFSHDSKQDQDLHSEVDRFYVKPARGSGSDGVCVARGVDGLIEAAHDVFEEVCCRLTSRSALPEPLQMTRTRVWQAVVLFCALAEAVPGIMVAMHLRKRQSPHRP